MREVLYFIDAYDKNRLDFFNLNTRVTAYYSLMPHVEKGRMPAFNSFLNSEEQKVDSISERAAFIRARYKELGYLK